MIWLLYRLFHMCRTPAQNAQPQVQVATAREQDAIQAAAPTQTTVHAPIQPAASSIQTSVQATLPASVSSTAPAASYQYMQCPPPNLQYLAYAQYQPETLTANKKRGKNTRQAQVIQGQLALPYR